MDTNIESFEAAVSHAIRLVGTCIEIFGVLIIVAGIVWSTYHARIDASTTGFTTNTKYTSAARCCSASKSWSPPISSKRLRSN